MNNIYNIINLEEDHEFYCDDSLNTQDFGFLDPIPQKYAIHRSRCKGLNINQKLQKKTFLLSNPKSEPLKKK